MKRPIWLVVGHGSVGSALARRLEEADEVTLVYDPSPRIPISHGRRVTRLADLEDHVDFVVSCVYPGAAAQIPELVAPVIASDSVLLDWNTLAPARKVEIAAAALCDYVDVALLDTLDGSSVKPRLAISGRNADDYKGVLESVGFHVDVLSHTPGDAALVKFARSTFMKGLEGLVLENAVITQRMNHSEILNDSLVHNLGEEFMTFCRVLIATDRLHGRRRASELREAVEVFRQRGLTLRVSEAAASVLEEAAGVWERDDAPPEAADVESLMRYLAERVCPRES